MSLWKAADQIAARGRPAPRAEVALLFLEREAHQGAQGLGGGGRRGGGGTTLKSYNPNTEGGEKR